MEYDQSPSTRIGGTDSSGWGPQRAGERPPVSSSAVPTTGRAAAYPGKRVSGSKVSAATSTAASPAQDASPITGRGRRPSPGTRHAVSAPMPSSQARVKGEKY